MSLQHNTKAQSMKKQTEQPTKIEELEDIFKNTF